MFVTRLTIPDVVLLRPERYQDERGFFSEIYNSRVFGEAGVAAHFVQDNVSMSVAVGTIRGLHFQVPPAAQAKLVRVPKGRIFDVAVDIRVGSGTFGQHVSAELTAEGGEQLYIPAGFAHGFCTLEPSTEIHYKVDAFYAPEHDRGILWNDPALGIEWPVEPQAAVLSGKDRQLPLLADLQPSFRA